MTRYRSPSRSTVCFACSSLLSPRYCRTRIQITLTLRIVSVLSVGGAKTRWVIGGRGCRQGARYRSMTRSHGQGGATVLRSARRPSRGRGATGEKRRFGPIVLESARLRPKRTFNSAPRSGLETVGDRHSIRRQSGVVTQPARLGSPVRPARSQWIVGLNGKRRKKRRRHLHCEFLKQLDRTRYVAVAQMHN